MRLMTTSPWWSEKLMVYYYYYKTNAEMAVLAAPLWQGLSDEEIKKYLNIGTFIANAPCSGRAFHWIVLVSLCLSTKRKPRCKASCGWTFITPLQTLLLTEEGG